MKYEYASENYLFVKLYEIVREKLREWRRKKANDETEYNKNTALECQIILFFYHSEWASEKNVFFLFRSSANAAIIYKIIL